MQQLRQEIVKLIQDIKDLDTLKVIYQFIKGLISGRK